MISYVQSAGQAPSDFPLTLLPMQSHGIDA